MKLKGHLKSNKKNNIEDHMKDHVKGLPETLESTSILLTDRTENLPRYINTVDQPVEDDFLLKNDNIEEIVAKLPDESSYVLETAHTTITYLQLIDEPAATEEILNNKEIIFIVQADKNEELVK
ncbi:22400_t:CDS:2 [Cetraspora pellucida]|uniref:22400_t:CDS:1 n=1 Tax=Cetraspora pellucida TaxID=1433469 RepID=A0A9N9NCA2_9GLOM|nr:22400_t:CDS:2 [Cetraspora pellucida]